MKTPFIQSIIANHTPCYFISPHLDDALFSTGGLLAQLQGQVPLTVINVFTSAGDGECTLSAKAYLRQCHTTSPTQLYQTRIKEDRRAVESLGARVINLGYTEALWRKKPHAHFPLTELRSVYPTYRLHIVAGNISPYDHPLMQQLASDLTKLVEHGALVFAPAGYGNHVDHRLVSAVCRKVFAPESLIYWSDFPYTKRGARRPHFLSRGFSETSVKPVGRTKLGLCQFYASQFHQVIPDPSVISFSEVYYRALSSSSHAFDPFTLKLSQHLQAFIHAPKDYLFTLLFGVSNKYYEIARINLFTHLLNKSDLPAKIGDFRLVEPSLPDHPHAKYNYGYYINSAGKRAFVKYWHGSRHDASYRWLKNELSVYQMLKSILLNHPDLPAKYGIRLPRYLGHQETEHSLALILEPLVKAALTPLTSRVKVPLYVNITSFLAELTPIIPPARYPHIIRRTPWYWAVISPYLVIKSLWHNLSHASVIISGWILFLRHLPAFLSDQRLAFVHRDLGDWNLWLSRHQTWLFDFQLGSFAHPYIDHVIILQRFWRQRSFISRYLATPPLRAILRDDSQAAIFRSYAILFALYDLSITSEEHPSSLAYLTSLVTPNTAKIIKSSPRHTRPLPWIALGFVCFALVLGLSIRGNPGSPSAAELNTPTWKDNGPFELSPERGRYALTYSLIENHSYFFSVPLARFVTPDLGYHAGHYVSLFAPGLSYLVIPGYGIGKLLGNAQFGTYAEIALFALANAYLIYLLARRLGANSPAALISGLIFLFATPSFAYAVNLYQHHISTFLVLAALYLALSFDSFWSLCLIWLLCGISIPVDYPNIFLLFPIGIASLRHLYTATFDRTTLTFRLSLRKLFTFVALVFPLSFFLWFNQMSYDNPLQFSGTVESVSAIAPNGLPLTSDQPGSEPSLTSLQAKPPSKSAVGFFKTRNLLSGLNILLLSPDRGLLRYTPVLVLALLGIISLTATAPVAALLIGSIIVANILLYSLWGDPWGGWAFGARYLIPTYALLSALLGIALTKWRKHILVLLTFLFLAIYSLTINAAGALSTSANPPQVQVLELEKLSGRQERYSFDRNLEYLRNNTSKSFIYRTWVKNYLTSWQYFILVSSLLVGLLIIILVVLYAV